LAPLTKFWDIIAPSKEKFRIKGRRWVKERLTENLCPVKMLNYTKETIIKKVKRFLSPIALTSTSEN
jgi:hypothetical protein